MEIKFTKNFFLLFFIFFLNMNNAQTSVLNDVEAVKGVSKQVTQLFKDNKINEAFKVIKAHWPLPENEIDNLETQTIQSLNLISQRYGKLEGTIKTGEQNIRETAFRETYLLKFENTALRLIFTYYKNNKGWIVNGFKWDSDFENEFK
ncbi:hypothetical protein FSS13T_18920 [Flavobacterium saliperosum S13]|uniref:DUF3887 domain-containing protein n=2 Tax=Flavobacterium saliperosum TaxID=329186 RepID=A0A1G4W7Z5_9FLAO|nr:hypothetical protein [Flavobacterium saliperosum]ESU24994.1 hypothetical protein FSS13T_18920 [Flavobacterium saliperosum S13]SCX18258.1 hypothetical protein SAMN02927925_02653 [Flavobacterium saliperosum]